MATEPSPTAQATRLIDPCRHPRPGTPPAADPHFVIWAIAAHGASARTGLSSGGRASPALGERQQDLEAGVARGRSEGQVAVVALDDDAPADVQASPGQGAAGRGDRPV